MDQKIQMAKKKTFGEKELKKRLTFYSESSSDSFDSILGNDNELEVIEGVDEEDEESEEEEQEGEEEQKS